MKTKFLNLEFCGELTWFSIQDHFEKKIEELKFFFNSFSIDQDVKVEINFDFERVIFNCQNTNRKSNGTWINNIILDTYIQLFKANKCHSVECYDRDNLVGGLYGLQIGGCFFGESMFSIKSNTSKYCLLFLIAILKKK